MPPQQQLPQRRSPRRVRKRVLLRTPLLESTWLRMLPEESMAPTQPLTRLKNQSCPQSQLIYQTKHTKSPNLSRQPHIQLVPTRFSFVLRTLMTVSMVRPMRIISISMSTPSPERCTSKPMKRTCPSLRKSRLWSLLLSLRSRR